MRITLTEGFVITFAKERKSNFSGLGCGKEAGMFRKWPDWTLWYQSEDGQIFVFYLGIDDSDMREDCIAFFLLSKDGVHFDELAFDLYDLNIESEVTRLKLEEPRSKAEYEVAINKIMSKAVIDGKVFKVITRSAEVKYNPLPRLPEYLYGLPNGDFVYVSSAYKRLDYGTFKLFFGPGENMKVAQITECPSRMRDGGTTRVVTDHGTLFSPAPGRQSPATWGDTELAWLDHRSYVIEEDSDRCTIRKIE